jgi:hypothetical protein
MEDKMSNQAGDSVWRKASQAYVASAVKLYLDTEAHVVRDNRESMGDAANVVCSIARAMEHLLKLRLLRLDPALLYPMPMSLETYVVVKGLPYHTDKKEAGLNTLKMIGFSEALRRVRVTMDTDHKSLCAFERVRRLRDKLEHQWDDNADYLSSIVGEMSSQIIPALQAFVSDILNEKPGLYFDAQALRKVETLDRALAEKHSLVLQQRIETQKTEWQSNPGACAHRHHIPGEYLSSEVLELKTDCPICGDPLRLYWDIEADFDYDWDTEMPIGSAMPVPKCVWCSRCHFYADGKDMASYLPDDLEYPEDESYGEYCDVSQAEIDELAREARNQS